MAVTQPLFKPSHVMVMVVHAVESFDHHLNYKGDSVPRYFIRTRSNRKELPDEEGIELTGTAALEDMMRRSLANIAHDEGREGCNDFSALATDEEGKPVVRVTLVIITASLHG